MTREVERRSAPVMAPPYAPFLDIPFQAWVGMRTLLVTDARAEAHRLWLRDASDRAERGREAAPDEAPPHSRAKPTPTDPLPPSDADREAPLER